MKKPNFVTITSGTFRNHHLLASSSHTHPMGSREKIALFNMLMPFLHNADILDVYAGSGALGLEALSLGAASTTFVEKSSKTIKIIKQNITSLNLQPKTTVLNEPVQTLNLKASFDIIIADPPYDHFNPKEFKNLPQLLKPNGILILSHPTITPPEFPNCILQKTKTYARAHLSLYALIS